MEIVIREKRSEDLEGLIELFRVGDEFHRAAHPDIFKESGDEFRREFVKSMLLSKNTNLFIALCDGEIIGFISVIIKEALPLPIFVPRRYGSIDNLVIKEEYRRLGVAQVLMHRVEEYLTACGIEEVELNVFEFNQNAILLYQKLGYQTVSRKMGKKLHKDN